VRIDSRDNEGMEQERKSASRLRDFADKVSKIEQLQAEVGEERNSLAQRLWRAGTGGSDANPEHRWETLTEKGRQTWRREAAEALRWSCDD